MAVFNIWYPVGMSAVASPAWLVLSAPAHDYSGPQTADYQRYSFLWVRGYTYLGTLDREIQLNKENKQNRILIK